MILALLLVAAAWAETGRFGRVAVVLSVQGPAGFHRPGEPASRFYDLHTLDTLEVGQGLKLGPKAVVTLSVLSSGIRYRLTGPLLVTLDSKTPFQPGKGISELSRQAGREGLVASQQIELSKFGGVSSRRQDRPIVTQDEAVVLDLDLLPQPFEASSLKVFYHLEGSQDAWTPAQSSLVHHSGNRDQLKFKAPLLEDKVYLVYIGDKSKPDESDAQFPVLRLPAESLKPVRDLEKSATDFAGQAELFEMYRGLRLFDQAEACLAKMRKLNPKGADWKRVQTALDVERHSGRG